MARKKKLTIASAAYQGLKEHGAVHVSIPGGRIFLSLMPIYGINSQDMLIVYSGGGSMLYAGDRPLNKFRLIPCGFPFGVAEEVAALVNAIVGESGMTTSKQTTLIEGEQHE